MGADLRGANIGERLSGQPSPHLAVVHGVGHADDFGRGVLRVVVEARGFQIATRPCFKITPKNRHTKKAGAEAPAAFYAATLRRRPATGASSCVAGTGVAACSAFASIDTHSTDSNIGVKIFP